MNSVIFVWKNFACENLGIYKPDESFQELETPRFGVTLIIFLIVQNIAIYISDILSH